jgi:hypothetical protein
VKHSFLLTLILLSLSTLSFGIGRTGNGIADEFEGFQARTPMEYSIVQPMGRGNIRLTTNNPIDRGNLTFTPTEVEILKVRTVFPEFLGYSRSDLQDLLIGDHWSRFEFNKREENEECLDLYVSQSNGVLGGLALWGQEKGIIIRGLDKELNKTAIQLILSTLKLNSGVCDWK